MSRDKNITQELVGEVAGIAGKGYLYDLSDALKYEDISKALEILDNLHNNSCDMERLCTELINHFRNLMIVKTVKSSRELVVCTDDEYNKMREQAQNFNIESILYAIDSLNETLDNLKRGTNRRVEMEMILIKLCTPKLSTDNKALLKRIAALENALQSGTFVAKPVVAEKPVEKVVETESKIKEVEKPVVEPEKTNIPEKTEEKKEDIQKETKPIEAQVEDEGTGTLTEGAFNQWPEVMKAIQTIDIPLFGMLLRSSAYVKGNSIFIKSENELFERFASQEQHSKAIKEAIFRVTGQRMGFGVYKEAKKPEPNKKTVDPLEDLLGQINSAGIELEIK